ncbi:hypothetical protein Lal_00046391 [Lupinus albus]|nr:hypothetical protein Lal_00046391 [Lupinus albus]
MGGIFSLNLEREPDDVTLNKEPQTHFRILRLEAVLVELAKLSKTKPNTHQASFGSSNVASFGSSDVASFGSSDVASFGSSDVASFGSSDVASFGSSDVASFGSSNADRGRRRRHLKTHSVESNDANQEEQEEQPCMELGQTPSQPTRVMPMRKTTMNSLDSNVEDHEGEVNKIQLLWTEGYAIIMIFSWNVRGLNKLTRQHEISSRLRIWCLWDYTRVNVQSIHSTGQLIHLSVSDVDGTFRNWTTIIYAQNQLEKRKILLRDITTISTTLVGPWLILRDFNNVLSVNDKCGGSRVQYNEYVDLENMMQLVGLYEADTHDPHFTYEIIYSRIDRPRKNLQRDTETLMNLHKADEEVLRQKSKIDWLKLGDGNNFFFHAAVKDKARRKGMWSTLKRISCMK